MDSSSSVGSKAAALRLALGGDDLVRSVGVCDAIAARVAHRSGFEALWAGGLGISAALGQPDLGLCTMTEFLEAATVIDRASPLPVIADCDTGFGDVVNVIRTVRDYEAAGNAAVCLEDKEFPKRNSFLDGQHSLIGAEDFAARIECAKDAQSTPDFLLIARLESLIAGSGMSDAMRRARLYAEAGAEAILVHSKSSDDAEIMCFAERWRRDGCPQPLIAVPTTYPAVSVADLRRAGYRMVIWANQLVRASVHAMEAVAAALAAAGHAAGFEDDIATVPHLFELSGISEAEDLQAAYLAARGRLVERQR